MAYLGSAAPTDIHIQATFDPPDRRVLRETGRLHGMSDNNGLYVVAYLTPTTGVNVQ